MIFLFTDFGLEGPYVGQMRAVLARSAPTVPVIELFSDLPAFDAKSAAYLIPAYAQQSQPGDVVMAVVDPGVGTNRACVALNADGVWFVGPDNGLLLMSFAEQSGARRGGCRCLPRPARRFMGAMSSPPPPRNWP